MPEIFAPSPDRKPADPLDLAAQPSPRILLISALDPRVHRGGMGTVTRSFIKLLETEPLHARIEYSVAPHPLKDFHRLHQLTSLLISQVTRLPAKAAFMFSRRLRDTVQQRLREEKFDLILLNLTDLLWLLPALPADIPRVLFAHNIEHHLYLSQIQAQGPNSPVLRRMLRRDWQRLHDFETTGLRRVKNVIFLSRHDADSARRECPDLNALLVPPMFDYPPAERSRPPEPGGEMEIGFMGNFEWWPNREGLRWFLRKVFPHLGAPARLHLFGQLSQRQAPKHPRVVTHGFVPEIRDVWSRCDFMICPIFSGGGVPTKLAEAIYNRVPVLTTTFAARGLTLARDPALVLLDHPKDWISFLNSPAAPAMRSLSVAEATAAAFGPEAHRPHLHKYLRALLHAKPDTQAGSSNP